MKTNKYITVIFIVVCSFLFQSCYTQLKQSDVEESDSGLQSEYPDNSTSKEIVGVWIKEEDWADYGTQYMRLEFTKDGRVKYTPNSERSNSEEYDGNYSALQVTLFIKFDGTKNTEYVQYMVDADTLFFYTNESSENYKSILFDDCSSCTFRRMRN